MAMPSKRQNSVLPTASTRPPDKADVTTRAARMIIETELAARNEKTMRLRAARLAQEDQPKSTLIPKKAIHRK